MNKFSEKIGSLIFLVIGFWFVIYWWFQRAVDGSDTPWGIGALLVLIYFSFKTPLALKQESTKKTTLNTNFVLITLLILYAVTFPYVPNLIRGIWVAIAFGVSISLQRGTGYFHFGTWSLAAMSLPLLSSLQFFLGYPLRWITTRLSSYLLSFGNLSVHAKGLILVFGPTEVWVDAPCSGVKMLWVGVFLASLFSFIFKLKNSHAILLFLIGIFGTLVGNTFRASSVFYLEAGIIKLPNIMHDLIGLVSFLIIALIVGIAAQHLTSFSVHKPTLNIRPTKGLLIAVIIAALVPFWTGKPSSQPTPAVTFPTHLEDEALSQRAISDRDQPFLAGFPGELRSYTTPKHDVLIRYVRKPTRKLHSSTDCYRGLGFVVTPIGIEKWARYRMEKEGEVLILEERIRDKDGNYFYDIGQWFWSAKLGSSTGPWWSEVRVHKL